VRRASTSDQMHAIGILAPAPRCQVALRPMHTIGSRCSLDQGMKRFPDSGVAAAASAYKLVVENPDGEQEKQYMSGHAARVIRRANETGFNGKGA
jgi:hypothetical protein